MGRSASAVDIADMSPVDPMAQMRAQRFAEPNDHDLEAALLEAFDLDAPPENLEGLTDLDTFSHERPEPRDF